MKSRLLSLKVAVLATLGATAARADLVISTKATQNVSCSGGVCTATSANAVLNTGDLTGMLESGDVAVKTGGGATNVHVKGPVSWTSASRLTLDANQSVEIGSPVSVTGSGAVTIDTNDGGSGGDLMFDGRGNVKFWDTASSLVINGNSYVLVKDIATLASDIAANPSGFYALANDHDASADGTYAQAPVTTELSGTFEGLGHEISNLTISSSDFWVGLFAEVSGTLRDLGLLNVKISGGGSGVGSLLGKSDLARIVGCYGTGSIVVNVSSAVGGLVGTTRFSSDGSIVRSYASVDVHAPAASVVGGLVGASGFSIVLSHATGRVKAGDNSSAGGLVGEGGNITQSYAAGSVIAGDNSNVGGLIGAAGASVVTNDYAVGAAKGGDSANVGGFAGQTGDLTIGSSYSAGQVRGKLAGGFLGTEEEDDDSFPTRNYWDIDTSGKSRGRGCGGTRCPAAIKGLTTEQFQSALPEGFDPAIWGEKQSINGGLPYLLALPPPQ